jgi:superfamily I DNA/RNA helicase
MHEMCLASLAGEAWDGAVADRLAAAVRKLAGRSSTGQGVAVDALAAGEVLAPLARRCGADLERFLTEIALGAEADALDPRADAITLLTLHAAKGLEFSAVFLAGCERGLLPLWLPGARTRPAGGGSQADSEGLDDVGSQAGNGSRAGSGSQADGEGGGDGEGHASGEGPANGKRHAGGEGLVNGKGPAGRPGPDPAEERRLLFVGMTRARAHLFLTSAAKRRRHGAVTATGPSPFLAAISPALLSRASPARSRRPADRQLRLI